MSAQDLPVVHRDSRCLGMGLAMSLSPWVAPDFGLKLLGDVWSLVAGLLAFILMVVHFVLVAEHKPIEGNGLHQCTICYPVRLRYLHPLQTLRVTNLEHFVVIMCYLDALVLCALAAFTLPLPLSFCASGWMMKVGSITCSCWLDTLKHQVPRLQPGWLCAGIIMR